MAKRKALAYSKRKVTTYSRKSKKRAKNYIKTVPQQKIVKFNMGLIRKFREDKFLYEIKMVAEENVQIRDMALEAVRQLINGRVNKKLFGDYYLACKAYPHQIMRDNKTFSGGSKGERVQTGMKHSFGSAVGRSAIIKKGKVIFLVAYTNKKDTAFIRGICKMASPKLPCKIKIVFEEKQKKE